MLKINIGLTLVLSFLIVYKSVFIAFLKNEYIIYFLVGFYLIFSLSLLLFRKEISRVAVWLAPFVLSGFISFLISVDSNLLSVGMVGFIATNIYFFYWVFVMSSLTNEERNELFNRYVRFHHIMAVGIALLAIYQFFVDPTIFGLVTHPDYANAELLDVTITRRATSLFGSPQNLAIYMGVACSLVFFVNYSKTIKSIQLSIFMFGGILSGSRAFVYFIIIFAVVNSFILLKSRRKRKGLGPIIIIVLFAAFICLFQYLNRETADRIMVLFRTGGSFEIWMSFVSYKNWFAFLFGNGIGVTERLVGVLLGKWMPETESYLIKLYYEMGLLGLSSFLLIYLKAIYNCLYERSPNGKENLAFLIAFLSNLIATPSFAGLTMSFVAWPFILIPLFVNGKNKSVGPEIGKEVDDGFSTDLSVPKGKT